MNRVLRWLLAIIGPAFLILGLYSAHLIGTGLHAEKVHEQLQKILTQRPLDPSILDDTVVAALVEPLEGTRERKSAEELLALGAILERSSYEEFQKRLVRPELQLAPGTQKRWSEMVGELMPAPGAPPADPAIQPKLRSELTSEITARLTPPLTDYERDYYDTVRSMSGLMGYDLPELPPAKRLETNKGAMTSQPAPG